MERSPWTFTDHVGTAEELHHLVPATPSRREVWRMTVRRPAIVLGSTQDERDVDGRAAARRGIDVARRRSGGGAVLLIADEALWVDVVVPRGDPLWDDDVNRSFAWLGQVWCDVIGQLGVDQVEVDQVEADQVEVGRGGIGQVGADGRPRVEVHAGGLIRGASGAAVCFAGLGPGEVTVGGIKLVGLAQRRTRDFARFQCTVHHRWRPDVYRELLAPALGPTPPDHDRSGRSGTLQGAFTTGQNELGALPPVATLASSGDTVVAALLEALATT